MTREVLLKLAWLLRDAPSDIPLSTARAYIQQEVGYDAVQQVCAAAAGLEVKPMQHTVTQHDQGTYLVDSFSARASNKESEHHIVDLAEFSCSCKGWQIRKWCSHIDSVIAVLRDGKGQEDESRV